MTEPIVLEQDKVYGMSNGSLNKWDKVKRGREAFKDLISLGDEEIKTCTDENDKYQIMVKLSQELFGMLRNDQKSRWAAVQGGTGYPKLWEFLNSSVFVQNNLGNFCTVSSSTLIVNKDGHALFEEQRYRQDSRFFPKLFGSLNCCRPRVEIATKVSHKMKKETPTDNYLDYL